MSDEVTTRADVFWRIGMFALIGAPVVALLFHYGAEADATGDKSLLLDSGWQRLCAAVLLSLFLPLLAYCYHFFRKERREAEIDRLLQRGPFRKNDSYVAIFRKINSGPYFFIAVGLAWVISIIGLLILFRSDLVGGAEFPTISHGSSQEAEAFPKPGSRFIFSMAFLGAYVWGMIYVARRYRLNDLNPSVFFDLSLRMLIAAILALFIFNAYVALGGDSSLDSIAWPAIAFFIGAFPKRAQYTILKRMPIVGSELDPNVRDLRLSIIEGIKPYDEMRLEEVGIDSCFDLATGEFVPLVLRTAYTPRVLIDWILQAKLCVICGESIKDLRDRGFRRLDDLMEMEDPDLEELARETAATKTALIRARNLSCERDIKRLLQVGEGMGVYTDLKMEEENPSPNTASSRSRRTQRADAS